MTTKTTTPETTKTNLTAITTETKEAEYVAPPLIENNGIIDRQVTDVTDTRTPTALKLLAANAFPTAKTENISTKSDDGIGNLGDMSSQPSSSMDLSGFELLGLQRLATDVEDKSHSGGDINNNIAPATNLSVIKSGYETLDLQSKNNTNNDANAFISGKFMKINRQVTDIENEAGINIDSKFVPSVIPSKVHSKITETKENTDAEVIVVGKDSASVIKENEKISENIA